VENLVAIELAYVNTRHPDFDEARLIYRGLADDSLDSSDLRKVDSSDLRKVSAHNAITHGGTTGKQVCEIVILSSVWPAFIAEQIKPIKTYLLMPSVHLPCLSCQTHQPAAVKQFDQILS